MTGKMKDHKIYSWSIERIEPKFDSENRRITGWVNDLLYEKYKPGDVIRFIENNYKIGKYIVYACDENGRQLSHHEINITEA